MLFEFHKCQNGQKPNSVHATYLVCGEKLGDRPSSDGDVEMASPSPSVDAESLLEPLPAITLCLVQEDQLKGKYNPRPRRKSCAHELFYC